MSNIKWVISYLLKIKYVFISSVILIILESYAYLAMIGIQKWIIDDVFLNGKKEELFNLLFYFALAVLSYVILFILAPHILTKNSVNMQLSLVRSLMSYLYVVPIKNFQNERVAKYVNNFTGDIPNIANALTRDIPQLIQTFIIVVTLATVIFIANPILLCLMIILTFAYIAFGKYFSPKLKKLSGEVQEYKSNYLVHIEEGISSTREIIAFNRMEWELNKLNNSFTHYFSKIMEQNRVNNKQIIFTQPFKWLAILAVLICGGYWVIKGTLSIGTFVIVYLFSYELIGSLEGLYFLVAGLSSKMANLERFRNIVEGEQVRQGKLELKNEISDIVFDNVHFKYQDDSHFILSGLNISISKGKKIGIVGTSGGGKSTITQLLLRFFEPTIGEILVNNIPLKQLKNEDWMNRVAIVFQNPYFFPESISNNLTLSKHVSMEEIRSVCKLTLIDEFIEQLPEGYETELSERGVNLSGGQRQRLALARALISNPELLILDEATSALDVETEKIIMQNLDNLRKDCTTVFIAHRLSTIKNSDLIFVINDGRVVGQGSHPELFETNTFYRELLSAYEPKKSSDDMI